jgi:hypothetical protein
MNKLQPGTPKNLEKHPRGLPFSLNVAATVAEAKDVGMVDVVDAEDMVDTVDTVEAVEPETATKVSGPTAKLTAILQMHAGSGNAFRREKTMEEMTSAFASSAGSQAMSKSILCVNEWWKVKKATATAALTTAEDCNLF